MRRSIAVKRALRIAHGRQNKRADGGRTEGDELIPPPRNPSQVWSENPVSQRIANTIAGLGRSAADLVMRPRLAMQQGLTTGEVIPWGAEMALAMAGMRGIPGGSAAMRGDRILASRNASIYNPPVKSPRPFEADYPHGATADDAGRLLKDIEGRPLIAEQIAGRRTLGGRDEALSPTEILAIGEGPLGARYTPVPARAIRGDAGRFVVTTDRRSGKQDYDVLIDQNLAPVPRDRVMAHETAHLIDRIADYVPRDGLDRELRQVYNTLNTGQERTRHLTGPQHFGYAGDDIPRELMAEAIRAYMADPNYLKTVAPKTAARIREHVNQNPALREFVQFNSLVGGAGLGAAQVRSQLEQGDDMPSMANGGEVDDWITPDAAGDDDWIDVPEPSAESATPGNDSRNPFVAAVTDIPSEIYSAGKSALSSIGENLNPFSAERSASFRRQIENPSLGEALNQIGMTGKGLLALPELAAAPITGAARSAIGHPYSALTGMPYEDAKEAVDTAMMGLAPARGGLSALRGPVPAPAPPASGPLGVTLSQGQATRELPLIQAEQSAIRGQLGPKAQARAQEFVDQQKGQLASARDEMARSLDPYGQRIVEGPQEAGEVISESMRRMAAQRKADVDAAYTRARSLPGEVQASFFDDIGARIKTALSSADEPVIIDEQLTPYASRALRDIDEGIARLVIQNRADPLGQPAREAIAGVTLNGIDQVRKRLSSFRQSAFSSGNAADGRAARAVIDNFDNQIDQAVNGGFFRGDPSTVRAWNTARAAHADYRSAFTAGKNDPVGRVVEKIIGGRTNDPAIPNDVADFMFGSAGVNPGGLNVGVVKRVRSLMGEQSPEWSAVKQGLFSRLIEPGEGVTDWGPGKVAQRLNRFMNVDGKEMSNLVFTPAERHLIRQYADLQRAIEVPQAGANWSNTATFTSRALQKIGGQLGLLVGAVLGRAIAPALPFGASEAIGAAAAKGASKIGQTIEARRIARQMPLVADSMRKWQKAVAAANRQNAPLSRTTLSVAAANLARSLEPLGIRFEGFGALQGAKNAPADENEQQ